jgi:membrane protein implicated in regulation of membrane protease activity
VINPLRSEAEAFRFVLGSLAYFGAIAIAVVAGGRWVGLAVFLLLTAGLVAWWVRARRAERPKREAFAHRGAEDERRILVIANETVQGEALRAVIRDRASAYREHVLVVVPALNARLRHWTSDEDGARAAAEERLQASLAALERSGVAAHGEVGDADPLQALEDGCRSFGPDEIIISTHPEGRSHWLETKVVERARERFALPITHVVVDLEAERGDAG